MQPACFCPLLLLLLLPEAVRNFPADAVVVYIGSWEGFNRYFLHSGYYDVFGFWVIYLLCCTLPASASLVCRGITGRQIFYCIFSRSLLFILLLVLLNERFFYC